MPDVSPASPAKKPFRLQLSDLAAIATFLSAAFIPAFVCSGLRISTRYYSILTGCFAERISDSMQVFCMVLTTIPLVYFAMHRGSEKNRDKAFWPLLAGAVLAVIIVLSHDFKHVDGYYFGFIIYAVFALATAALLLVKDPKWHLPIISAALALAAFFAYYGLNFIDRDSYHFTGYEINDGLRHSNEIALWAVLFTACPWIAMIVSFAIPRKDGFLASASILALPWLFLIFDFPREAGFPSGMITYLVCVIASFACALKLTPTASQLAGPASSAPAALSGAEKAPSPLAHSSYFGVLDMEMVLLATSVALTINALLPGFLYLSYIFPVIIYASVLILFRKHILSISNVALLVLLLYTVAWFILILIRNNYLAQGDISACLSLNYYFLTLGFISVLALVCLPGFKDSSVSLTLRLIFYILPANILFYHIWSFWFFNEDHIKFIRYFYPCVMVGVTVALALLIFANRRNKPTAIPD